MPLASPIFLGCTWAPLITGPWCSCVLNSYIIFSLTFSPPPLSTEMPPFSQWWHFYFLSSLRITMNAVIAHWWFLLHPNVKREGDQHLGHLLPLTAAWFSVASSRTATYSFWRRVVKEKVHITYFPMIVCTLVSFSILLSLFLHEIKTPQFWSSLPHYALISNYYPWKRNWLFFWLIPENNTSLLSIHELGKQKAKN